MRNDLYVKQYEANSLVVNFGHRVGLYGLLGMLQDIALLHASKMGIGLESMIKSQAFWVLTKQKLKMTSWPAWGSEIKIVTWSRGLDGIIATRDFEIYSGETKIGECSTSWLVLDAKTRRPTLPVFDPTLAITRTDYALPFEAKKISNQTDTTEVKRFEVRNSDLDFNEHVNNTKYSQWVLDSIPLSIHRDFTLLEYEINFIAETHLNDVVVIKTKELPSPGEKKVLTYFQGIREKDQKIVFAVTLLAEPK